MKEIGMARKVDRLGRIVLPAEMRRLFSIDEGDLLEIHVDEGRIILSKLEIRCTLCGSLDELRLYRDKRVCQDCIKALNAS